MHMYCMWCGNVSSVQPCPHCGRQGLTDVEPSNEPCAYCGRRPTWPITWTSNDGASATYYLCGECDHQEMKNLSDN
jgi:hypothetical protein